MSEPERTMAIIQGVTCGYSHDTHRFHLRIGIYMDECSATFHIFDGGDAVAEVVEAYQVADVAYLHGRPCWVNIEDRGLIKWVAPCVNWVMEEAGIEGTNSAMARPYRGEVMSKPTVEELATALELLTSEESLNFYEIPYCVGVSEQLGKLDKAWLREDAHEVGQLLADARDKAETRVIDTVVEWAGTLDLKLGDRLRLAALIRGKQ